MKICSISHRALCILLASWVCWINAFASAAATHSWTISHSFDGGKSFSQRGTLEWKGGEEGFSITNEDLSVDQAKEILSAGWYHVKIDSQSASKNEDSVLATVPSCFLRRSNFKDEFTLTFPRTGGDGEDGGVHITSLTYAPLISPLAPKSCIEYSEDSLFPSKPTKWSSKAHAILDTPAMTLRAVLPKIKPPPGLTWMPRHPNASKGSAGQSPIPGQEPGAEGPNGEPEDQRPFFIKYWYVILPLVLANFLSVPEDPKAADGSAGGGDGTPAPVNAAPAASNGGAKRRGKRS